MRFELDVDKLAREHDLFLARQERIISRELERAGDEAKEHVMRYPEFNPGPRQELQRATQTRVVRTSSGRVLRITNPKPYASAIDQGARPHVITPKRGKFLRFVGRNGIVFARRVNHPGNRPYRFLYNATDAAGRGFQRELTRALTELGDKF